MPYFDIKNNTYTQYNINITLRKATTNSLIQIIGRNGAFYVYNWWRWWGGNCPWYNITYVANVEDGQGATGPK